MPDTNRQTRTVALHETDASGVMQMAHYLRYMEVCEHDFIHSLGFDIAADKDGVRHGWPRVDVKCSIDEALCTGDKVDVELLVASRSSKSVAYCFNFHKDGKVVARGYMRPVHVTLDSGKGAIQPSPMPEDLAERLTPASDEQLAPFKEWLT